MSYYKMVNIRRVQDIPSVVFTYQTAALAPRKELPSLIPGSQARPADIFLPNWERGHPTALDVTVISTLQPLTLQGAALTSGHALAVGENRKMAMHASPCQAVGVSFVPLVFESLGGLSDLAAKTVSSIGRLLGQRLGILPSESVRHLFQRCSISLWRGNASLWLHRYPTISPHIDSTILFLFLFLFFCFLFSVSFRVFFLYCVVFFFQLCILLCVSCAFIV